MMDPWPFVRKKPTRSGRYKSSLSRNKSQAWGSIDSDKSSKPFKYSTWHWLDNLSVMAYQTRFQLSGEGIMTI